MKTAETRYTKAKFWRKLSYTIVAPLTLVLSSSLPAKAETVAELKAQVDALEKRLAAVEGSSSQAEDAAKRAEEFANQAKDHCERTIAVSKKVEDIDPEKFSSFNAEELFAGSTRGFEFHGYLRSGFGINGKGGDQVAFQAPGAWAKYRLGNETETYGELIFAKNWLDDDLKADGVFFKTQVLLTFVTGNNANFDANDTFTIRESFAEAGGVLKGNPSTKFWAGQRFYRRHDIHINDFYFLDMSGYGGGFQDMALGEFAKLSVAYLGGSRPDLVIHGVGDIAKQNLDVRVHDIALGENGGNLTFHGLYSYAKGGTIEIDNDKVNFDDFDGFGLGVIHVKGGILGGFNKVSVQYGDGAAFGFNTYISDPFVPANQNADMIRVTEQIQIQPSEKFGMMAALVWQRTDVGGEEDWFSIGARPIFFINKYFGIAVEAGYDYVDSERNQFSDGLFKFTIAPQITPSPNFWSRPSIRAYITYANWGDEFKGSIGGEAYRNDTDGISAGVQIESWW